MLSGFPETNCASVVTKGGAAKEDDAVVGCCTFNTLLASSNGAEDDDGGGAKNPSNPSTALSFAVLILERSYGAIYVSVVIFFSSDVIKLSPVTSREYISILYGGAVEVTMNPYLLLAGSLSAGKLSSSVMVMQSLLSLEA